MKITEDDIQMFQWGIETITFSGGEEIPIDRSSTFIIIGPNNSGKSTALRELTSLLNNQISNTQVIKKLKRFIEGNEDTFLKWLVEYFPSYVQSDQKHFVAKNLIISESSAVHIWKNIKRKTELIEITEPDALDAWHFLFHHLDTRSRLSIVEPVSSKGAFDQPNQYIHILQMNDQLLTKISSEVCAAFQKDLIINWGGGGSVWFHVGEEPQRTETKDRVSLEYLEDLQKLPRLEMEGDGIRSFVATLLASYCGAQPVLLIDEPEVFLHPPQIKRLASILAKNAESMKRQIIIATHSSDIVQGAIAASRNVSICRITREGNLNHATILTQSQIEELWSKPLLKSSAAIDGVFHEGVIVSEADSDSRIYEAVLSQAEKEGRISAPTDFYFVQGGGKGELSTLAKAYKTVGVKVVVIADFDLLQNKAEFEKVIISLSGDFKKVESNYTVASAALGGLGSIRKPEDFVSATHRLLAEITQEVQRVKDEGKQLEGITATQRRTFGSLLEDSRDWSEAKKYGITKLKGGAHQACTELLEDCKRIGLFIVPNGPLESWWRAGASDKNEWFVQAIEEISKNPSSFREAIDFMVSICEYLKGKPQNIANRDAEVPREARATKISSDGETRA
ncbi:MAG: ATP-dependent nuclease [Pyrinomonadaceae bacterium]